MLLKILPFVLYTSPLSVQAWQSRSCLSYVSYASASQPSWDRCKVASFFIRRVPGIIDARARGPAVEKHCLTLQQQLDHEESWAWPPPSLSLLYFLCLTSPCPIPRTCSFSWFCKEFCLLPAQFCYIVVCVGKVESRVHLNSVGRVIQPRSGLTENASFKTSSIVARRHRVQDAFLCCVCTGHYLATGLHCTLLPPYGYSGRTAISSFPRAVLLTSVIGFAFPRGPVHRM
jgi:hypothetical protein